jgi:hypothetical protein
MDVMIPLLPVGLFSPILLSTKQVYPEESGKGSGLPIPLFPRQWKIELIEKMNPDWQDLFLSL